MARYKSKGIRGNWAESAIKLALSAIKNGTMKISTAAKNFNVPRRTLRRYLSENKERKSSLGRKPLLTNEQENLLESRIIRLSNVGYPLTQRVLRSCVKKFCDAHNITAKSQSTIIGRDWLRGFLKRHKNISIRKAQNLNPARAQKLNKAVVSDYFAKLKNIMEDNDILNKPERIFNIDEKGCQLKLHKTPQVLAERGSKRVHFVASEHGENVTIVSCGNALGHAIPPMILFKGTRMKPEWIDALPTGAIAQMTPKGSMNIDTFVNWIHHFQKFKLSGSCILIFDGAKCHLDYSITEAADKYNIKLFCLPSNTTHEIQPMDKAVFRSFEYYWDEKVLKYWSIHEDRKITKQRFGVIFSKVWDKAVTPANIKAGFEATGIYPYNPDRIPEEAYAPSIPTHNPVRLEVASPENDERDASDDTKASSVTGASESVLDDSKFNKTLLSQTDQTLHFDSEDEIPLAMLCNKKKNTVVSKQDSNRAGTELANETLTYLYDILKTPEKISSPINAFRKKAINSLAQGLTKQSFNKENIAGRSKNICLKHEKK